MADLNDLLSEVQNQSKDLNKRIKDLFIKYDHLYKESYKRLVLERDAASGNMDGLEEFYRLVNIIRRNRDVTGSLARGVRGLRATVRFKFVEEDTSEIPKKKEPKLKRKNYRI